MGPPRRRTVLVVEDDDLVRRSLRRALSVTGHRVYEASTVDEAIETLSDTPIEAVTLDIGLGDRRGLEVVRFIAASVRPRPIVVVLTGEARPREAVELVQLGVHAVLEKPVDVEELDATLRAPGEPLALEPAVRQLVGHKSKDAIHRLVDEAVVDEALASVDGNVSRAATLLGTSRQAIHAHLSRRRQRDTPE